MIVYQITNKVNDEFYIGITTKTLKERFNKHMVDARYGRKYKLHNAIRKYGTDNFTIKKIDEVKTIEELRNREIELIEKLNPSYNISPGGTIAFNGHKHTEEHKKYMSNLHKGENNPNFGKTGYWLGKKINKEMREKMSIGCKNKKKKNCIHCHNDFDPVNYSRWHGDKCKEAR